MPYLYLALSTSRDLRWRPCGRACTPPDPHRDLRAISSPNTSLYRPAPVVRAYIHEDQTENERQETPATTTARAEVAEVVQIEPPTPIIS